MFVCVNKVKVGQCENCTGVKRECSSLADGSNETGVAGLFCAFQKHSCHIKKDDLV